VIGSRSLIGCNEIPVSVFASEPVGRETGRSPPNVDILLDTAIAVGEDGKPNGEGWTSAFFAGLLAIEVGSGA